MAGAGMAEFAIQAGELRAIRRNSWRQDSRFGFQPAETMLRFNPRQRAALSETFRELANLVAAALVIGQVVAEQPPSLWLILMGFGIWVGLVWFGVLLEGD